MRRRGYGVSIRAVCIRHGLRRLWRAVRLSATSTSGRREEEAARLFLVKGGAILVEIERDGAGPHAAARQAGDVHTGERARPGERDVGLSVREATLHVHR